MPLKPETLCVNKSVHSVHSGMSFICTIWGVRPPDVIPTPCRWSFASSTFFSLCQTFLHQNLWKVDFLCDPQVISNGILSKLQKNEGFRCLAVPLLLFRVTATPDLCAHRPELCMMILPRSPLNCKSSQLYSPLSIHYFETNDKLCKTTSKEESSV